MGTQFLIETRTMKFLVVLALVAAAYAAPEAEANAEAEPWWYSNYGSWGGYRYASPYWNRGYAYASPYYRGYWKRDAEAVAEPEAKADAEAAPWWYSNYGGWGCYRYANADPEAWYSNWYGRRWGGWGYGYRPYGYGAYGYGRWW